MYCTHFFPLPSYWFPHFLLLLCVFPFFFIFILKFHIHMCGVCLMKVIFDTFTQTDNLILVLFLMNELWYQRTAMDFPNGHLFELFGFSESDTVAANNVNTNFINVFLLCTFRFEWIGLLWNVGGSQHEIGVRHVAPSLTMSGQRGKLLRVWCTIRQALSYNLSECSGFDLNDLRIFCCLHLLPNDLYFHNATFENGMILLRFFCTTTPFWSTWESQCTTHMNYTHQTRWKPIDGWWFICSSAAPNIHKLWMRLDFFHFFIKILLIFFFLLRWSVFAVVPVSKYYM